jgi:hypothetical protein
VLRLLALSIALSTGAAALPAALAASAGAQTDGPSAGVVYTARKGPAEVRLVGLGRGPGGDELVLLDVRVECGGFHPQARLVGVVEEDGRFEVEGPVIDFGTTDVVTGEFDDIDGKVRSDGAVLEIDIEVEGEDNAGPTGRCEETQPWRLEPRPSRGARRIDVLSKSILLVSKICTSILVPDESLILIIQFFSAKSFIFLPNESFSG